jgi:hypothetical protein
LTVLSRNGESVHPCLVPDFRENGFSFSPNKYDVDYRLVIYSVYNIEVHSFYS